MSSWLLHTELRCASGRHPSDVPLELVREVLDTIDLVEFSRGDLLAAGAHAPLRSNDAIHLAAALRVGADEMLTYDDEVATAAEGAGLQVLAPGRRPV